MICKRCGEENPDAKRVCTKCGAFLEGYTFNNVTGDYGYRGADGEWYKTEEDYRARCQAAEQSPIDHAKLQLQILLREEIDPEFVYLTRAWLLKHGWKPTKDYPLFQGSSEYIDPDLCVVINRKDYMVAKFHYMGDDAWNPSAKPDSFEIVGVNNFTEMLDYDHTRLVMAAYVCHLTGFEEIDNAIGGVYEMTMTKKD